MLRKHFSIENWRIHRQTTMTISSFHWLESCILIRNSHEDMEVMSKDISLFIKKRRRSIKNNVSGLFGR